MVAAPHRQAVELVRLLVTEALSARKAARKATRVQRLKCENFLGRATLREFLTRAPAGSSRAINVAYAVLSRDAGYAYPRVGGGVGPIGKSVETYRPRPRAELDRTSRHRERVSLRLKSTRRSAARIQLNKHRIEKANSMSMWS